ncbi:unnamed protein product [Protopolystoma xenopodis]|uniref:Uncharacterized protein n=1 Tax=Protopolystoma xenopodis TaxID=117903 RepID=A0A3S5CNF1_9PLAT|nr:unnamed protein product [Protopolystoma xenopodis]
MSRGARQPESRIKAKRLQSSGEIKLRSLLHVPSDEMKVSPAIMCRQNPNLSTFNANLPSVYSGLSCFEMFILMMGLAGPSPHRTKAVSLGPAVIWVCSEVRVGSDHETTLFKSGQNGHSPSTGRQKTAVIC